MTIRANKVVLAGSVSKVNLASSGKNGIIILEVPAGAGSKDDDGPKTTMLNIVVRDDGSGIMELAKSMKSGDFMQCICEYYKQPVQLDGKDKPWGLLMLQAIPGHIIHIPGQGAVARMAGGGLNFAVFGGTVIKNPGVKNVGAKNIAMLRLTLACEPKYDRSHTPEQRKEMTTYMDVTAWRGLAEKWLSKAQVKDSMLVIGRVSQRQRDDLVSKGKPMTVVEIDIDDVSLETPEQRGGGGGGARPASTSAATVDDDLPF